MKKSRTPLSTIANNFVMSEVTKQPFCYIDEDAGFADDKKDNLNFGFTSFGGVNILEDDDSGLGSSSSCSLIPKVDCLILDTVFDESEVVYEDENDIRPSGSSISGKTYEVISKTFTYHEKAIMTKLLYTCTERQTSFENLSLDDKPRRLKRRFKELENSPDPLSLKASASFGVVNKKAKMRRSCSKQRLDENPELISNCNFSLPRLKYPQIPSSVFGSISSQTLAGLLRAESFSDKYVLVDCRYPYEYNGGHIVNAINIFDFRKEGVPVFFSDDDEMYSQAYGKIPIFYCEFSQKRGPTMATNLRSHDRDAHTFKYPYLDYPEVYVLDRGYNMFFHNADNHDLCMPSAYVTMLNHNHRISLITHQHHHGAIKSSRKHKKSFSSGDKSCARSSNS